MRKLLLATLLACFATAASAQCSGIFPAGTVCGNSTGVSAPPKASAISGFALVVGSTPITGGSSGQVLYDNAGILGEYTAAALTGQINVATATLSGAIPAWPNNTTTFFRGDGTYASPSVASLTGLGTGVATALGVNIGTAGAVVVNGGALGTPSSGTLTSATGLPISSGVSGLGTGAATALGINVGSAGALVTFNGALGTPSSGTLTNATGLPIAGQLAASTTVGGPVRARYQATAVNFNSGNTDTTFTLNLPSGVTRYIVSTVRISHASASLTTSTFGLFTAASGGGVAIMTGVANTISTASESTNNNAMGTAPATGATQSYNASQLFFRVQTAQGTAATADVHVEIIMFP